MKPIQFLITTFVFVLILFACSKEDNPEPKTYDYDPPSYDQGHLMVKVTNIPAIVDSIIYTNITKGVTNKIDKSGLVYYQNNNYSVLSLPMANGNTNDQLQCCVYINQATGVGVEYYFRSADSIQTTFINSNVHCIAGNY